MNEKIQGLSESLSAFQEQIQNNYDLVDELVNQRESLRVSPANKKDILKRIENVIESMCDRYIDAHKNDMQKLTSYRDSDEVNIFTKTVKVADVTLTLLDPDAFVFFNQDSLLVNAKALSEKITLSDAGLPFDEREKKIDHINKELSKLEGEKLSLHKQAAEAGLVVAEEYVDL